MGTGSAQHSALPPSAGIGRTGCFIATRIGCQQLRAQGQVDILGIVCHLRIDRLVLGQAALPGSCCLPGLAGGLGEGITRGHEDNF